MDTVTVNVSDQQDCEDRFSSHNRSGIHCAATWDSIHCWPPTPANQVVTASCTFILSTFKAGIALNLEDTKALAYRVCDRNGSWLRGNWTNYTECEALLDTVSRINHEAAAWVVSYVSFVGSIVSLVALSVAMFIFCYFRSLQCDRLSVHKNLVASFILRFVVMLIIAEPSVLHRQHSFVTVEWVCKLVVGFHLYSVMANINWMFAEGFYLHSRITVSVFYSKVPFAFFHFVGWVLPALYVFIWVLVVERHMDTFCWLGFSNSRYKWILAAPMALALLINLIFLLNIIRILVTKLRANNTVETTQIRKAVKATAVLLPLLGTTNLLFFVNPRDDGHLQNAYFIVNAVLQSTQGIFVAVLYCFMNTDVGIAIRKRYWRIAAKRRPGCGSFNRKVKWSRTSSLVLSVSEMPGSFVKVACSNGSHVGSHRLPRVPERWKR